MVPSQTYLRPLQAYLLDISRTRLEKIIVFRLETLRQHVCEGYIVYIYAQTVNFNTVNYEP